MEHTPYETERTQTAALFLFSAVLLAISGLLAFVSFGVLHSSVPTAVAVSAFGGFNRNLSVGSVGPDVKKLQEILNSDPATRIASAGPGSPGQETDYFGTLTQKAVVAFQEKYRAVVLSPAGIVSGTGYVGTLTRDKLNEIVRDETAVSSVATLTPDPSVFARSASSTTATTATTTHISQAAIDAVAPYYPDVAKKMEMFNSGNIPRPDVYIMQPSPIASPAGTLVGINGGPFTQTGNIVHLGDKTIPVRTLSSSKLIVTVPYIAPGRYDIWVENGDGKVSNKDHFFIVTDPSLPTPVISSIAPGTAGMGTEVTITGTGFSKTSNAIHTGVGTIQHIPSPDGKTLHFTMGAPEGWEGYLSKVTGMAKSMDVKLYVYVDNTGGISNGMGFTFHI